MSFRPVAMNPNAYPAKEVQRLMDTPTLRELATTRGREVVSNEGGAVGRVSAIIYDYISGEPVWIGIGSVVEPKFRTLLVPARSATGAGQALRVAFSNGQIEGQPHADLGAGFDSLSDTGDLYQYFDMGPLMGRELRVLHEG